MAKNKVGRKLFDGKNEELVLSKLQEVWGLGGSDGEAAFFADISTSTLSRYLESNPDIRELRDKLKEKPILQARRTLVKSLENNPVMALQYLERKKKDEFSPTQKIEHSGGQQFSIKITTVTNDLHGASMATDEETKPSVAVPDGQHDQ